MRDLASGNIDIPAGMSPVVLTFDDSTSGQYRILDDGTLDPESAVGILQAAVEPGDWASKATFYCLLDVASKDNELFGQPDRQQEKLRNLVDWGYEVGSHTVSNLNLRKADGPGGEEGVGASRRATLEELIGGDYQVTSLSVPSGEYPEDESLLAGGIYDGKPYKYTSAVTLGDTALALAVLHPVQRHAHPAHHGDREHPARRDREPQGESGAAVYLRRRPHDRLGAPPTWPKDWATAQGRPGPAAWLRVLSCGPRSRRGKALAGPATTSERPPHSPQVTRCAF